MLQNIYFILSVLLILFIVNIHKLSSQNKFRINLLVDGVINKILLGLLLCIIIFDNFLLGILFMIFLLILQLENQNKNATIEGFSDYYKNIC